MRRIPYSDVRVFDGTGAAPFAADVLGEQARESGVWLTGHAHAAEAIKMGLRNGFRVLYHCTYADHMQD